MVEVFKTSINDPVKAIELKIRLLNKFPGLKISFDLEDCDKILRIEASHIASEKIMEMLTEQGVWCEILQDSQK